MATMNVSLPTPMVEFVEDMVASGGYSSSSEVVREALRLLRHERAIEQEKAAILRREVGIGLEQARAERFSDRTVSEIAEGVMQRATRR
ncbi:type II toxin-antitoxin system ParD family antitoxin [Antarcticirhabdus aurantiaca]|uniref:Type II toxin-antitoxin system ParD family antitoxin n=1 Tax=Antarcticirhabdus aurantiaca TaxID=2606717 RepID=A0ACD4NR67_9HYPH|nr:type II toxin-antitoxin system ParD family antitoxin [Antarcticirhabdus aurantiaca]WAJ29459.1 type II toxin-antitoxin system ParD family antitoxin [Jeongeuplla avenae]